jgi:RNA polymerase sigma-70 factor (ECF subfamily)
MADIDETASIKADLLALVPRLRRFGYALSGNRDDADDLLQIALERAIMRLDQWQPGTRLDAWVFRIMHNAWIDEVRARSRRGASVELDDGAIPHPGDSERDAQMRIDLARARAAMDQLPDDQRVVLTLVAIEGQSYQEAAAMLGVPIGTIMSRLSRARKALVSLLEQKAH